MELDDWTGERIKALRKHLGLSQAELAKRLKISAGTLKGYEQGKQRPGLPMRRKLRRQALKV